MTELSRREAFGRSFRSACCLRRRSGARAWSVGAVCPPRRLRATHRPRPYRYAGTNMWYAAYLGANAPYGNRDRLKRELDRVAALGIQSIRILGSSELSPLKNSVTSDVSRQDAATTIRRCSRASTSRSPRWASAGIKAVIYLANFWEWSGGFMTYLYWTNGGHYINMNDPAHPWPEFPDMSSEFYGSPPAVAMLQRLYSRRRRPDQQHHRPPLRR